MEQNNQPTEKELKIKIIVAFALALSTLQGLCLTSVFESFLTTFLYVAGTYSNLLTYTIYFGALISMDILALYYINEGRNIETRPYYAFKKATKVVAIISLVVCGIVATIMTIASLF